MDHRLFAIALAPTLATCAPSSESNPPREVDASDAATIGNGTEDAASEGGVLAGRPYTLVVPSSYDASKPTPFLFMMHGYPATAAAEEHYMGLTATAQTHGFLYAYADGTLDSKGNRFWNATDACCNFDHLAVDDVAYIDAVLADVSTKYNVDAKRVFLLGHSNGGFMAHRYACDRGGNVAAIVSLAGAVWNDPSLCSPSSPVAIAEVHGDEDAVIAYDGGTTTDSLGANYTYPSAHQTVATWATKDGCAGPLASGGTLSLDTSAPANATEVQRYSGCAQTSGVELWTMHGSKHVPALDASWGEAVWTFFSAHPKAR